MESVTGMPAAVQVLSIGSTILATSTSTVSSYGVVSGSTVALALTEHAASLWRRWCTWRCRCRCSPAHGTTLTFSLATVVGHGVWLDDADRGADWPGCGRAVAQLCCHARLTAVARLLALLSSFRRRRRLYCLPVCLRRPPWLLLPARLHGAHLCCRARSVARSGR